MAGIVVDAEAALDVFAVAEVVEEGDGFGGIFDPAEGFGFEPEVEVFTGTVGEAGEPRGVGGEVFADEVGVLGVGDEFFVTARDGGDAAGEAWGEEVGEDGEEGFGVFDASGGTPIGLEDLFLDAGAVELAVGEAVDGEDVAIVLSEPALEDETSLAVEEGAGGFCAETEADGVGLVGSDAVFDFERVIFEGGHGFRP